MKFNSLDFAIFIPIIFILYWFVAKKNTQAQNSLLVLASYFFYGWWDYRFLSLILFSTLLDFAVGLKLKDETRETKRKMLLYISIFVNLGLLGVFKYYNFFIANFNEAFSLFGQKTSFSSLKLILPAGISFYTFQTMSYTIDVYKKKLSPSTNFIQFCAFVSFFPQLVAGPIERASNLLPQFEKERKFDRAKAVDGLRQILWGLFKKVVIADTFATHVNTIFNSSDSQPGSTLVLGALFFSFQIYGDFSGYSDIAIGTSRLFGFDLKKNFAFPYFSRDIAEFWRRWHISLSTWFRDYLYIPLGGSRGGKWLSIRNTFIIFIVSGFWHGPKWTFLIWGALHALFFLPLLLSQKNRTHLTIIAEGKWIPSFKEAIQLTLTFSIVSLSWIFFRANDVHQAFDIFSKILSSSLFESSSIFPKKHLLILFIFLLIEWLGRENNYAIEKIGFQWKRAFRHAFYYLLCFFILWFSGTELEFIYFQF